MPAFAAETIRYTWNQLARSAGKWVKGLMAAKHEGREEERRKDGCSLRNDSLYHCRVHLPSCLSSFFAHSVFRIFAVTSVYIYIYLFFLFLHFATFVLSSCLRFSLSSLRAPIYMTCLCLHSPVLLSTNGSSTREGWTRRSRDKILRHFYTERPQLNRR